MGHDAPIGFRNAKSLSDLLYDRLERGIIALEYALADVRKPSDPASDDSSARPRLQEALLSAGEEVRQLLALLQSTTLGEAAARARDWR